MPFRRLFFLLMMLLLSSFVILAGCTVGSPEDRVRTVLVTVEIVITATTDPNATPNVIIITATPDRTQVNVPQGILPQGTSAGNTDPLSGTPIEAVQSASGSGIPDTCLQHTVADGDTFFGLAAEYGVNPFVMLEVNGRTEDNAFLNVGDIVIVPIEGCPIEQVSAPTQIPLNLGTAEATSELTPEVTESANTTPTVTPTITLAPTAVDSEIEIVGIVGLGDVTAEGVRIRNNGSLVDVTDWVLTDADGNSYTFGNQLIFSNSELTLYTRAGQDVPIARFWGLEQSVWQANDVVTLLDDEGDVQAIYRIPEDLRP